MSNVFELTGRQYRYTVTSVKISQPVNRLRSVDSGSDMDAKELD